MKRKKKLSPKQEKSIKIGHSLNIGFTVEVVGLLSPDNVHEDIYAVVELHGCRDSLVYVPTYFVVDPLKRGRLNSQETAEAFHRWLVARKKAQGDN